MTTAAPAVKISGLPDVEAFSSEANRSEVFIGLVGAMGTDLKTANEMLVRLLANYGYDSRRIRISDIIKEIPQYANLDRRRVFEYYSRLIEGGNYACKTLNDKGALAEMAVERIVAERGKMDANGRRAFIIHSLKRPEEVRRLREIYGGLFYTVAVFADEQTRIDRMTRLINAPDGRRDEPEGHYQAQRLVRTDEREDEEWGQKVSDTFAQSDYFVRSDDATEMERGLSRFLELVFNKPFMSPTRSEVAMMHAYAAGLRSADLSRQIGAVVAARDGRILTTGCNDVPSPGGGQYWSDGDEDERDWKRGEDLNDVKKRDVIVELLRQLDSIILPEMLLDGVDALYDELVRRDAFAGTRADALIEFSRAAHAEMAALNGALLSPVNVRDCDVYTTTFPCHMCTRLIIGAGIRNVVYIEPYPKSASVELYGKTEIQVNAPLTSEAYYARIHDADVHDKRTYYIPFEGVAPRRFTHLFSNAKGKSKDGSVLGFVPVTAKPRRIPSFVAVHRFTEEFVAKRIAISAETLRQATTPNVQTTETEPPE